MLIPAALYDSLRISWWGSSPDGLFASNPASHATIVLAGRVDGVLTNAAAGVVVRHTEPARLVGSVPAGVVVGLHDVGVEGVGLAVLLAREETGSVAACNLRKCVLQWRTI